MLKLFLEVHTSMLYGMHDKIYKKQSQSHVKSQAQHYCMPSNHITIGKFTGSLSLKSAQ